MRAPRPVGFAVFVVFVVFVLDGLTIACAAAAMTLVIVGPFRGVIGGDPVALRWTHAAFAALALAVTRHLAFTGSTLIDSVRAARDELASRPALVDALIAAAATRPAVLLVGLLAVSTIGVAPAARDLPGAHDPVVALPARWDAQWYAGIAAEGYAWEHQFQRQQNLAFFPALPLLMRASGYVVGAFGTGVPYDRQIARLSWCGVAVSLVAFFWAAVYLARIAHELLGDRRGRNAVLLLAAYPFAVFYSAAYTEALFLLAALGAWFHFRRGDWAASGAWGLVAGLTRPNGCFLSLPLLLLAMGARDAGPAPDTPPATRTTAARLLAASMPIAGMLVFTAYVYQLTGIWFAWSRMHEAWGRVFGASPAGSGLDALDGRGLLRFVARHPYDSLNGLGFLFALLFVPAVWRRLGIAWALFVLVNLAVPLAAGGLLSMGRLTSTLFPVFLAAASLSSRTPAGTLVCFGILQGLVASLFFTWRDMY